LQVSSFRWPLDELIKLFRLAAKLAKSAAATGQKPVAENAIPNSSAPSWFLGYPCPRSISISMSMSVAVRLSLAATQKVIYLNMVINLVE